MLSKKRKGNVWVMTNLCFVQQNVLYFLEVYCDSQQVAGVCNAEAITHPVSGGKTGHQPTPKLRIFVIDRFVKIIDRFCGGEEI